MRRRLAAVAVLALLLSGCTSDPEPKPAPQPSSTFQLPGRGTAAPVADGATPFGAHWDWNRFDAFKGYLGKLKGSSTYYELSWCDVEQQQGTPNWARLDQVAQETKALGISLDLKIRIGTCWATGGEAQHTRGQAGKTESRMPLDMAAYQTFVGQVVSRSKANGVTQYAIENEVNAQQYWAGTPEEYDRLVRAGAEAVHRADPQAKVADSGISSVAMGMGIADRLLKAGQADAAVAAYTAYFERRVGTRGKQIPAVTDEATLRTALANPTNVRNLAFLAATEKLLDDGVVQTRQLHFYEHPDGITPFLEYLKAETPAGVPLEAWEVGRFEKSATADADQAAGAEEMTKVASRLAAGGITEVVWLPLAYNPQNKAGAEVRYGLLDPAGRERPAGKMLADLAGASRGATASPVTQDGLDGVAFSGKQGTRMVLWAGSGTVDLGLPGKPLAGGANETTVDATPVLVESDQPLDKALDALGG
jgi:hypothetical protein